MECLEAINETTSRDLVHTSLQHGYLESVFLFDADDRSNNRRSRTSVKSSISLDCNIFAARMSAVLTLYQTLPLNAKGVASQTKESSVRD